MRKTIICGSRSIAYTIMSSLGVHAVALLSICDMCTRAKVNGQSGMRIGGLFGTPSGPNGSEVWFAFELKHTDGLVDMAYLAEKDELLKTMHTDMRLLGWFVTGKENPESWMLQTHAQIATAVSNPLLCIFSVPFTELATDLPVKGYRLQEGQFSELPLHISLVRPEEIAVNDAMSARSRGGSAVAEKMSQQTNAIALLHQRLSVLSEYLQASLDGGQTDPAIVAAIVTTVNLLCRPDEDCTVENKQKVEEDVLIETLSSLILQTDQRLISMAGKF